jgi:hypothetical protein
MPPALLKLIRLLFRARFRRITRGMRTRKGIAYTVVAFGLLAVWIGPSLVLGFLQPQGDPQAVRDYAPIGLLALWLLNLLSITPESGITFQPAEVDLLFPGPYRRRELLAYKMVGMTIGAAGVALMFTLFLARHVALLTAAYLGAWLGVMFIQLLHLAVTMFAANVAERAFTRTRRLVLLGIGTLAVVGMVLALRYGSAGATASVVSRFRHSWIGVCLLAPFEVYGRIIGARNWFPELIGWGAAGAVINGAFALIILWLDADYLESSVFASQRLHERLQRVRGGTPWHAARAPGSVRRIARPRWWWGAGPIAWRQLVTAARSARGLLIMFLLIGVAVSLPLMFQTEIADVAVWPAVIGMGVSSMFYFPQMVRFDFRGDVDRMETLKALPVSPAAIVLGELMIPVLLTTFLQLVVIATLAVLQPGLMTILGISTAFLVPANILVFGLENLVFLLYPYRLATAGGLDLQVFGRQMVIMFGKFVVLFLTGALAAGIGGVAFLLSGKATAAFVAGTWLSVFIMAAGMVPLITLAYRRFDPSSDTPP